MNYYNEFDPKAAAWLRELIRCGLIPPGEVDQRSIVSVRGAELAGFTQCHFFAGIGGWSLALQLANWPQDRPVWTGSCPCQPFSNSGSRLGTADERHLWPEFARLIAECQPANVFGEQVASKAGRVWLAGVRADLEGMGYAVGGADLCAAGVGAPHIRQRIYWMAVSGGFGGSAGLSGSNQGQERDANFSDNSGGAQRSFSDIWGGGGRMYGWFTPTSRDWKDSPGMKTEATNPDGSCRNRIDQLPRQAQLASGPLPGSSNAQTARRGVLNPAHSRWLMGFPVGWDSCGATAMQSCRSSRRNLSKH